MKILAYIIVGVVSVIGYFLFSILVPEKIVCKEIYATVPPQEKEGGADDGGGGSNGLVEPAPAAWSTLETSNKIQQNKMENKEFIAKIEVYYGIPKGIEKSHGAGGNFSVQQEIAVVEAKTATEAMNKVYDMFPYAVLIKELSVVGSRGSNGAN